MQLSKHKEKWLLFEKTHLQKYKLRDNSLHNICIAKDGVQYTEYCKQKWFCYITLV